MCNDAETFDDHVFIICKTIAEELDRAETKGPLHGLPFSVKDQFPLKVCTMKVDIIHMEWAGNRYMEL